MGAVRSGLMRAALRGAARCRTRAVAERSRQVWRMVRTICYFRQLPFDGSCHAKMAIEFLNGYECGVGHAGLRLRALCHAASSADDDRRSERPF
jgi:hypothetical protein